MTRELTMLAAGVLAAAAGADLNVTRVAIASGGDTTFGGPYRLVVTMGEAPCGRAIGSPRSLEVGFLFPADDGCGEADLSGSSDPNQPGYGNPDGVIDASDFFYFLDQFAAGNLAAADVTGSSDPNDAGYGVPDGVLDASDFFYYLDAFVVGCE